MKKVAAFLLCLIFVFGLMGCKSNDETALSSGVSSIVENVVSDNSNTLSSTPSQQENISSDITSNNVPSTPDSKNETTSSTVNSSSGGTTSTPSKPQQTVVDDPNTITAPNGDKINISITGDKKPEVIVKVNGKQIYKYSNYTKYADQYDFDKDFTNEIIAEYSDEDILWAYRFNWGIIYSTKYTTTTTDTEAVISYACSKHEYGKCYYRNLGHHKIATEWNLIDYEVIEQTGTKIFWNPYVAAQAIFEYFYKTEDYTLKQIDDLTEAGYSIKDYYTMHNKEFSSGAGLNRLRRIYEISVDGKPFALIYSEPSSSFYILQELHWKNAASIVCKRYDETGAVYEIATSANDKLTDLS